MKLYGTIAVHVQVADILRAPKFFDKVRKMFGGKPDLRTGKVRSAIEATVLVEATRDALRQIGATNAVSLVIDDTVLFHDREGKPDDLGDLYLAFDDNSSVFGQGFDELRLAVEHREAGLHLVMEVQARPVHARELPAIRMILSGRIEALTPKPGEDAEAYRARAEPVATDAKALELYRVQFEAFVERVRTAIAQAMPTGRAEVELAEARVVRPDAKQPDEPPRPDSRYYDPYVAYYPSPLGTMAEIFMWSAVFSMMMPPHFVVVDHANHVQGFADDPGIQEGPTVADTGGDGGSWWEGDAGSAADTTTGGDDGGSWWGGDGGGGDGGGSWWGGDDSGGGGGDFGGGGDW
ncbi:MAG: hypothetical protein ABI867_00475 [Kofleriaceae bacterium]